MPPGPDGGFPGAGRRRISSAITASFRSAAHDSSRPQARSTPTSSSSDAPAHRPDRPVTSSANPASVEQGGAVSITPPPAKPPAGPETRSGGSSPRSRGKNPASNSSGTGSAMAEPDVSLSSAQSSSTSSGSQPSSLNAQGSSSAGICLPPRSANSMTISTIIPSRSGLVYMDRYSFRLFSSVASDGRWEGGQRGGADSEGGGGGWRVHAESVAGRWWWPRVQGCRRHTGCRGPTGRRGHTRC